MTCDFSYFFHITIFQEHNDDTLPNLLYTSYTMYNIYTRLFHKFNILPHSLYICVINIHTCIYLESMWIKYDSIVTRLKPAYCMLNATVSL